ncbi:hypothetical protein KIN20_021856 [Parelaphostrongylus tenuis]|uniref:Uncharacterized protein n=1 Tax=Parelaphostrongylus tenuis TaxID=148309 RepID=A0AAD5MT84_PARTN|nr:hypothetical protein KIN20_021856 [Parelaphostrongylus tenuis]
MLIESPVRDIRTGEHPKVIETVTTAALYEEMPYNLQYDEKRYEPVPSVPTESPVSEVPLEDYQAVTENVSTVALYEEMPYDLEYVEKRYEPEPPMLAESPDAETARRKTPVENYPAVTEGVTRVAVSKEEPDRIGYFEKRDEAESRYLRRALLGRFNMKCLQQYLKHPRMAGNYLM